MWDLVDPKVKRILDALLKNKGTLTHLKKLSKDSRVSAATTYRITNKLVTLRYVRVTRIGKMKLYSIADNEKTRGL